MWIKFPLAANYLGSTSLSALLAPPSTISHMRSPWNSPSSLFKNTVLCSWCHLANLQQLQELEARELQPQELQPQELELQFLSLQIKSFQLHSLQIHACKLILPRRLPLQPLQSSQDHCSPVKTIAV
ncbi:MAG: hypothetical protein J3R72DRAFT_421820 [Linnemannia gamsii]|nr:MAG: hypothetical protein J3R72DRAFT_421820 [Linnemannia gamsii]